MNTLLSIFNTGGVTLALTIVALLLIAIFGYQLYKGQKSGSYSVNPQTGERKEYPSIKWYNNHFTWYIVAVVVLYIVALLFIASDYKGV